MEPLFFNPINIPSNYTGTNPLTNYNIATHQMFPSYFNPNLYNSFTFSFYPQSQVTYSSTIGTGSSTPTSSNEGSGTTALGGAQDGVYSYLTVNFFSTLVWYSTQFSTYLGIFATDVQMQSVTFSYRFGTELQTLYFSENALTSYTFTYENVFLQTFEYLSVAVETFYSPTGGPDWTLIGTTGTEPTQSIELGSIRNSYSTTIPLTYTVNSATFFTASSMFVNMLGSNVYTGLLVTTNSIIIYNNEQVSSYYSQSLSYQVNIANLTAALNNVSGDGLDAQGSGTITVTTFSWSWTSLAGTGWTGSQVTSFASYLYSTTVNSYLSVNYGGSTITNSSVAVTQIQQLITVQNNDLANAQTFLNNAVTTLQSQVSLAGQIIGSLASAMQGIITNMA